MPALAFLQKFRKELEEYLNDIQLAPSLFADAKIDLLLDRLKKYERPYDDPFDDPRGFEWHYWWRVCHPELLSIRSKDGPCWSVTFDAEGKRIISLSRKGLVTVWEASNGREVFSLPTKVGCLAVSPDKKLLATAADAFPVEVLV